MRVPKNVITVSEFINELKKLDPDAHIMFEAVGEIGYKMEKEHIPDHFTYRKKMEHSHSAHYEFVL